MNFFIQLDYSLFHFINQTMTNPWLDSFFPYITDLHKNLWFECIASSVLLFFYLYKYQRKGVLYFFFCILSLAVTDFSGAVLFKNTVKRPRPFNTQNLEVTERSPAHGYSFISNHSSNMFAFATYSSAFFPPARFVFFGIATIIAISRVYNGVHFPLDVICGALWGIAISLIFIRLVRWIANRRREA